MTNNEIQEILQQEAQALLNIPITNDYQKAISLIIQQIHNKKGKLVTSGMGKAGQIALNISTTFSSTGTPSVFLHPSEAQHGDLGILQDNDLLLVVSNSGKTKEIIDLIKDEYKKQKFICMQELINYSENCALNFDFEDKLSSGQAADLETFKPDFVLKNGIQKSEFFNF